MVVEETEVADEGEDCFAGGEGIAGGGREGAFDAVDAAVDSQREGAVVEDGGSGAYNGAVGKMDGGDGEAVLLEMALDGCHGCMLDVGGRDGEGGVVELLPQAAHGGLFLQQRAEAGKEVLPGGFNKHVEVHEGVGHTGVLLDADNGERGTLAQSEL